MIERQSCYGSKKHLSIKIVCILKKDVDLESIHRSASEVFRHHGVVNVITGSRISGIIGRGALAAVNAISNQKGDEVIQIPVLIKKILR